jgi:hypothetical protein
MPGSYNRRVGGEFDSGRQAAVVLWVAVIAALIAAWAHISNLLAAGVYVGVLIVGFIALPCVASVREWSRERKACQHGIRSGARGGCQVCLAEADHIEKERAVQAAEWARRKEIADSAGRLRAAEIERLSKAWLSNAEAYLQMNPQQFEGAIAELFRRLGYEVEQTPFSNDGGKDAIAKKDGKKYLIECKRYAPDNSIGRREVQVFVAAMQDEKADGGFYINTGKFTRTAKEYAGINRIELYDRLALPLLVNQAYPVPADASHTKVMCLECGAVALIPVLEQPVSGICSNGHSVSSNIVMTDLRVFSSAEVPYCDRCGSPMRIVNGRRGRFWGCTGYPSCVTRRPLDLRHLSH